MKLKVSFLFASCMLLGMLHAGIITPGPLPVSMAAPPCSLPAPSNLQYTQPDLYSVQFTWDPVVGAAGYRSVLVNLTSGSSQVSQLAPNNATFQITPGDNYSFTVAAMCSLSPPETSTNMSNITLTPEIIIIELIAQLQGCTPQNEVTDGNGSNGTVIDHNWSDGTQYFIELIKTTSGVDEKLRMAFKYKTNEHFELRELDTNSEPSLLCAPQTPSICTAAPVNANQTVTANNSKFTYGGRTCRISFPDETQLYYYVNDGETAFNSIKVYSNCRTERSDGEPGDATGNQAPDAPLDIAPVNPFSGQLTLFFSKVPGSPVKTRLLDLQGRLRIQTLIRPWQAANLAYSIPTEELPAGLYFLQVETEPGQVVTRKVMKF